MATLVSPGSLVTVTDESFGSGSGPGTVPLIILATSQDKLNASGDDIAVGTAAENAGKLYQLSSQRELLQTFGLPNFNSVGGSALHAHPTNEYGLLAAHSYLGIANRAYCVRADVDLAQLEPSDFAPYAPPPSGTYWLDPANVDVGLYEWHATRATWIKCEVLVHTGDTNEYGAPINSGDLNAYAFALVVGRNEGIDIHENQLWRKNVSVWQIINSDQDCGNPNLRGDGSQYMGCPDLQYKKVWPSKRRNGDPLVDGDLWINTTVATYEVSVYDETSGTFSTSALAKFATTTEANAFYGDALATAGTLILQYDAPTVTDAGDSADTLTKTEVDFQHAIKRHNGKIKNQFISTHEFPEPMTISFTITAAGVDVTEDDSPAVELYDVADAQEAADIINDAHGNAGVISASVVGGKLAITHRGGEDMVFTIYEGTLEGVVDGSLVSNWKPLSYVATESAPTGSLPDGTLWYSAAFEVDLLINNGEGSWINLPGALSIQPSAPDAPSVGDVWVDTDQLSVYPAIYTCTSASPVRWRLTDNSDQSTPFGIKFADARVAPTDSVGTGINNGGGSNPNLDRDAPDPLAYPEGMLLWNTRYSTRVVKEYKVGYDFGDANIEVEARADRWVLKSGTDFDGSLLTGLAAVKKVVVTAMAAVIVNNDAIRSEFVFYNLLAAPGYPELIDELVGLNIDKKELAFVIGDTPMTLKPDSTSMSEWASNANLAATNGDDGLITRNEYLGVYYPSGLATNLDGTEVVVPPSHMMLRVMAYNDQVAYQWYAPAGLQRGIVSNAVSVGYVDDEGEYVPTALGQGQRDILYLNDINPIKMDPNSGVVVWGQKTRSAIDTSAMSRVNVARLINYIRYQLDRIVQPFFFQPNDAKTRGSVKTIMDSFLSELVTLRGLTDFLVVCDSSNNSGARIDRNELWIDIAIVPTKAIEFIYIPVRIKATGSDLGA